MAEAFTSSATIERPREEVWATLTDWSKVPAWMQHINSMRADGPTSAGTQLWFEARGKERPSMIADLREGESLTLRSTQGGVTADYHYRLTSLDATTTRLDLRAECATSGAWSLVGPLLRFMMARSDRGQPEALKQLIEAD
ncbi:MAG: SRPBCC family protein [Actinomycetota bacterium]